MRLIIRFFINSNIWVAFCITGLGLSSEILLGAMNLKVSKFIFFSTIFAYNFQRLVRFSKGHDHTYKDWFEMNRRLIYLIMFLSATVCAYLFFEFKLITQKAVLLIGILSALYPFFLRKIPLAKIFIISFVWTFSIMMLLVFENNIPISQNIIWQFVSLYLFVFSITIPFDIRDIDYDKQNVVTIPLFFEVRRSKKIAIFSLLICVIISFFLYIKMVLIMPHLLALIFLYILASILILKSDKKNRKTYFSFWVESLSVLSYFLLVISELIF